MNFKSDIKEKLNNENILKENKKLMKNIFNKDFKKEPEYFKIGNSYVKMSSEKYYSYLKNQNLIIENIN